MTRDEMIAYIISMIQTDANLVKLLRFVVTNNLTNSTTDSMPDYKLAAVVNYLQNN